MIKKVLFIQKKMSGSSDIDGQSFWENFLEVGKKLMSKNVTWQESRQFFTQKRWINTTGFYKDIKHIWKKSVDFIYQVKGSDVLRVSNLRY